MTTRELLRDAERALAELPEGEETAFQFVAHVLGVWKRSEVTACFDDDASTELESAITSMVQRRLLGEPTQYITGETEFYGLRLYTTPAALIPRSDTETLVDCVLKLLPSDRGIRVLDVGTGSGCIAIALAFHRPDLLITATDISRPAIALATQNAERNGIRSIQFTQQDIALLQAPEHKFDVIVSNPPYIGLHELPELQTEIIDHEPRVALTDEADGFRFYTLLATRQAELLRPGGWLAVEVGFGQAESVAEIFRKAGLTIIETLKDLGGIDRAIVARKM